MQGVVVHEGCDHILFVGFAGAGKSTLARRLSSWCARPSFDVDRNAELLLHQRIEDVWQEPGGEQKFRDAETAVLKSLEQEKSLLVACGSGIVEREENEALLSSLGTVVFLDGTLQDSLSQIQSWEKRPDMANEQQALELYRRRRARYQRLANFTISISQKSFEDVARECADVLWKAGLL
jgi:shikimate kinase